MSRHSALVVLVIMWGAGLGLPSSGAAQGSWDAPRSSGDTALEELEEEALGEELEGAPVGEGVLPVPMAERPLTLAYGTLRVDVALEVLRQAVVDPTGMPGEDTFATLIAGGAFGLMDELEVGLQLLPLILSPDFQYGDIRLYGTYRFLSGDVELGARVELVFPANTDFGLAFAAPLRWHATEALRLDTGLELGLTFADDTVGGLSMAAVAAPLARHPATTRSHAGLPVTLTYGFTDAIFASLRTGFGVGDFTSFGDTIFVPLGLQGGYTVAGDTGPFVDLLLRFEWQSFLRSGPGDTVEADKFQILAVAQFYRDLL